MTEPLSKPKMISGARPTRISMGQESCDSRTMKTMHLADGSQTQRLILKEITERTY
jgi:hypothetical protein